MRFTAIAWAYQHFCSLLAGISGGCANAERIYARIAYTDAHIWCAIRIDSYPTGTGLALSAEQRQRPRTSAKWCEWPTNASAECVWELKLLIYFELAEHMAAIKHRIYPYHRYTHAHPRRLCMKQLLQTGNAARIGQKWCFMAYRWFLSSHGVGRQPSAPHAQPHGYALTVDL